MFLALRDPSRLGGRCGRCDYRERCGGSRDRAWALTGDYLAEDPGCSYQSIASTAGQPAILRSPASSIPGEATVGSPGGNHGNRVSRSP